MKTRQSVDKREERLRKPEGSRIIAPRRPYKPAMNRMAPNAHARHWHPLAAGILLLLSFASCTQPPANTEFQAITKSVDVQAIQKWAEHLLMEYREGANAKLYFPGVQPSGNSIIISNIPSFFTKLPSFGRIGPFIRIAGPGAARERHVALLYFENSFGGNGHLLAVGSHLYLRTTNAQCFFWAPGAYFERLYSHPSR
jgi:hypothetical protein